MPSPARLGARALALVTISVILALSPRPLPRGKAPAGGAGLVGIATDPGPGTRDPLGYLLPLDIERPRATHPARPAPRRDEILARRVAAAASVFEEHRLSADDGHTQNETSIDVRDDTLVAGWNSYTDASLVMGVGRSTDGGHSWTSTTIAGHTTLSDPAVKTGGNGLWFFSYVASGGPGGSDWEVFVRRSTDAGATWGAPVAVTNDTNFDDKPYIDARGNEVLVGYADFGFSPAKVRAARSTDGGLSFGSDVVLANNSVGGNGACPVIDASGMYYMFWRDSFQESLWVSRSTNQGASWSADRGIVDMNPLPSTLPGGFRMVNLPSAAADPATGDLIVVWNDQRFGNPDILSIRSTDGGTTWSAPIRVNNDAGAAAQFFPWIDIDPSGVAHVVWYDRRQNGFDIDVYYARSTDGGASFGANIRVTAQSFPPILPWEGAAPDFIGDYNGIAAGASTAYPCYQDAREGNQDIYVALLPSGPPAGLAGAPAPVRPLGLAAAPSPFAGSTVIRAPAFPGATLDIVTPLGRVARQLRLAADGTARWDGRDGEGRALPRGVYLVRLPATGEAVRVVKLD